MIDDPPDDEPEEPGPAERVTVDAASPEGLKQQRRTQKRKDEEAHEFWHQVFSTPIGRREIWAILHIDMHTFNQDFASGPVGFPDPNAAWYRRGEQDMGLRLYHRWSALEPDAIRQMHVELDPRFRPSKSVPRGKRKAPI